MNETPNICIGTPDADTWDTEKTLPELEQKSSDIERNSSDIERNSSDIERNSSDVERNSSDVERNSLDMEKNNISPPSPTFDVDRWKVKRKRTQFVFCWVAGSLGMEYSMTFATIWMYLKDLVKTDDAGNIFSSSLLISLRLS